MIPFLGMVEVWEVCVSWRVGAYYRAVIISKNWQEIICHTKYFYNFAYVGIMAVMGRGSLYFSIIVVRHFPKSLGLQAFAIR